MKTKKRYLFVVLFVLVAFVVSMYFLYNKPPKILIDTVAKIYIYEPSTEERSIVDKDDLENMVNYINNLNYPVINKDNLLSVEPIYIVEIDVGKLHNIEIIPYSGYLLYKDNNRNKEYRADYNYLEFYELIQEIRN